jgi:hypothetical protein
LVLASITQVTIGCATVGTVGRDRPDESAGNRPVVKVVDVIERSSALGPKLSSIDLNDLSEYVFGRASATGQYKLIARDNDAKELTKAQTAQIAQEDRYAKDTTVQMGDITAHNHELKTEVSSADGKCTITAELFSLQQQELVGRADREGGCKLVELKALLLDVIDELAHPELAKERAEKKKLAQVAQENAETKAREAEAKRADLAEFRARGTSADATYLEGKAEADARARRTKEEADAARVEARKAREEFEKAEERSRLSRAALQENTRDPQTLWRPWSTRWLGLALAPVPGRFLLLGSKQKIVVPLVIGGWGAGWHGKWVAAELAAGAYSIGAGTDPNSSHFGGRYAIFGMINTNVLFRLSDRFPVGLRLGAGILLNPFLSAASNWGDKPSLLVVGDVSAQAVYDYGMARGRLHFEVQAGFEYLPSLSSWYRKKPFTSKMEQIKYTNHGLLGGGRIFLTMPIKDVYGGELRLVLGVGAYVGGDPVTGNPSADLQWLIHLRYYEL